MDVDTADDGDIDQHQLCQVKFITTNDSIRVTETPVEVPTRLTRVGLSQIVNMLLAQSAESAQNDEGKSQEALQNRQFDFVLAGEHLRVGAALGTHMNAHNLSVENVHEIHYDEAVPEPRPSGDFQHDDWVSSIAIPNGIDKCVATSCYDGTLHLWDTESKERITSTAAVHGAAMAIHGVDIVESGLLGGDQVKHCVELASAGADNLVRVTALQCDQGGTWTSRAVAELRGHDAAVQCVSASADRRRLVSGGWDAALLVFDYAGFLQRRGGEQAHGKKRRKTGAPAEVSVPAMQMLEGHKQCVQDVTWPVADRCYSASWDCTLRAWDIEHGIAVDTYTSPTALSAISYSMPGGVLAAAGCDRHVRVWDRRAAGGGMEMADTGGASRLRLSSHRQWCSDVQFHPDAAHLLLSASHDRTVKVWDLRATRPLYTVEAHDDKVLCVQWLGDEGAFASGGADSRLAVLATGK